MPVSSDIGRRSTGHESRGKCRLYVVDLQCIHVPLNMNVVCHNLNLGEGEGVGAKLNRLRWKRITSLRSLICQRIQQWQTHTWRRRWSFHCTQPVWQRLVYCEDNASAVTQQCGHQCPPVNRELGNPLHRHIGAERSMKVSYSEHSHSNWKVTKTGQGHENIEFFSLGTILFVYRMLFCFFFKKKLSLHNNKSVNVKVLKKKTKKKLTPPTKLRHFSW